MSYHYGIGPWFRWLRRWLQEALSTHSKCSTKNWPEAGGIPGAIANTAGSTAASGVKACPRGTDKPEPTCTNRHQCWEPCGELGHSAEHAVAVQGRKPIEKLGPDAVVGASDGETFSHTDADEAQQGDKQ